MLDHYITQEGVEELNQEKLPDLLELNCVSGQLLKKPVRTMADLENAILRTMEHMREKEIEDE